MTRAFVVLAVLATLGGGLTGCSSGGGASPAASPSASGDAERALDIGRRFAQCARDHGYPDFPDPELNGDKIAWPVVGGVDAREQARRVAEASPECKALADELAAFAKRTGNPSPDPSDLPKLRAFAECMRTHGIPEWPDPKADGTFPVTGTPLESEGESERFMSAVDACKQHYGKRITTS
jgi:hypothetical protein